MKIFDYKKQEKETGANPGESKPKVFKMQTDAPNVAKTLRYIILAIIIVFLIFDTLGTVGAGERGVLLQFGAVKDKVFDEGLYVKIPLVQRVKKMDVKIQKEQVNVSAASKDLQVVTSTIAINYHLNPETVNRMWQSVGAQYESRIIDPAIQEVVKATTALYTAEELITKREMVKEDIKLNIKERLAVHNIIVDEFNIVDFDFSSAFNAAIEAKVTAEQLKLKADRDLERIRVEAEQKIADARGKAEAIRIEAQALLQNKNVIELRWIEKWDGHVPTYWGQASPFIGLNR